MSGGAVGRKREFDDMDRLRQELIEYNTLEIHLNFMSQLAEMKKKITQQYEEHHIAKIQRFQEHISLCKCFNSLCLQKPFTCGCDIEQKFILQNKAVHDKLVLE